MSASLVPFTFQPLPLGSIQPLGWLRNEMQSLADGLAGHEMDFYTIVSNSRWLGGSTDYSDLNEGLPYWFNGLVPLAYGLGDSGLQSQVVTASLYILDNQIHSDGWIGPETSYNSNNLWGRFPLFLGLMQLVQANSSMAARVIPAMHNFVNLMDTMLLDGQSNDEIWGRARYGDMVIALEWLYEKYPQNNTATLMQTMQRLMTHGLDWADYYTNGNYVFVDLDTVTNQPDYAYLHGVNVGQGLKTMAVDYRHTNNVTLLQRARDAANWTFQYHGQSSGTVVGDERESGVAPNRGSELCTVVETMFSMSYNYHVIGDNYFADRCELAAFNALPVMMTPDSWAHQYIAQTNQPWSRSVNAGGLFYNTNDQSQTYGLDPNYPCCTVNHPQGFPKFLSASFVAYADDGLAHALLSPAQVTTTLANGATVTVTCNTNYPFSSILQYSATATKPFVLYLRIPEWSNDATVVLNGESLLSSTVDPHTGMFGVIMPQGSSVLTYILNPTVRVEPRANSSVAIFYGALLYALDVGSSVSRTTPSESYPIPQQVYNYVINNTLPWNYAIDPSTATYSHGNVSATLPNPVWDYHAPPGSITVQACPIVWNLDHAVPSIPPPAGSRSCVGPTQSIVLRPYGSLKVHMAELPLMDGK